jgi:glycosyltransferase involved in cell wall biosynthesis
LARILAVIPHVHHSRTTTELLRLAQRLQGCHDFTVISLKGDGRAAARLRRTGVTVHVASSARRWDLGAWYRLRRLVEEARPDLIHAWGLSALQSLYLACGKPRYPVLLSNPFANGRGPCGGLLDGYLLRRCQAVVVPTEAQQQICRHVRPSESNVELIKPAAPMADLPTTPLSSSPASPNIVCIGPLQVQKGFYEAIWAFDVLRHLHGHVRLCLIGAGPDLARLQRFVNILGIGHAVRLLGECDDIQPHLQQAVAVWVPSLADAGHHVVLEAMAAGRPVVASHLPGLAELVRDGESGFLVPPGKKVGFAKKTKLLVENPALAAELGQAGLRLVHARHQAGEMVERYSHIYQRLAG